MYIQSYRPEDMTEHRGINSVRYMNEIFATPQKCCSFGGEIQLNCLKDFYKLYKRTTKRACAENS